LALHYLEHYTRKHHAPPRDLSEAAVALLADYPWPGNVRELRNVMERAVILGSGPAIDPTAFPEGLRRRAPSRFRLGPAFHHEQNSLAHAKANAEREELLRILQRNGNNRVLTAEKLGISRTALYKKLRKHGLL
jgi:DNA-binding NtrC family response regulator